MNNVMKTFLSTSKKSASTTWRRGITLFVEWYGKDIETILEERKDDLTPRKGENLVDKKFRSDSKGNWRNFINHC